MAVNVSFAGNNLQNGTSIIVDMIDHMSLPTKDAKQYALSHASASKIPFISYPSKTITVKGTLIGTSIANLDSLIDTLKSYLITAADQTLAIDWNNISLGRVYTATVNKMTFTRPGNFNYGKFEIEFVCNNPYGQDPSSTTALNDTGRTSGSYSDSFTFTGTAPWQRPVITITYSAISPTTSSQSVSFGNNSTGQVITVTRTWTATDVLVIDCTQKTVTVNGLTTGFSFSGAFPEFAPGSGTMVYGDSFTSRTMTENVVYTALWL